MKDFLIAYLCIITHSAFYSIVNRAGPHIAILFAEGVNTLWTDCNVKIVFGPTERIYSTADCLGSNYRIRIQIFRGPTFSN